MKPGLFRVIVPATILVALLLVAGAHAADCRPGCSCMLPEDAKKMGYEPCDGKLTTVCGYDMHQTAKYCYAQYRPTATVAAARVGLPDGWYAYHATSRIQDEDDNWITIDSTFRYDISSEFYNGQPATRTKMTMKTTSPEGPASIYTDIYTNPATGAVLGGTATATMGGKTQSVNVAEIAGMVNANSGVTYSQPGSFSTSDVEASLQALARQTGGRVSTSTETVTVPAGRFSPATRHSISISDEESTATMNLWTAPNVPVLLKMQAKDSSGTSVSTMELTGYGVTGGASPGGPLGGILTGAGESDFDFTDGVPFDISEIQDALLDSFQQGLDDAGLGIVDISRVPAAAAESVTPAAIGAAGALVGGIIGGLALVPAGGFPETGRPPGTGGQEGGEGPESGAVEQAALAQDAATEGAETGAPEVAEAGGPDATGQGDAETAGAPEQPSPEEAGSPPVSGDEGAEGAGPEVPAGQENTPPEPGEGPEEAATPGPEVPEEPDTTPPEPIEEPEEAAGPGPEAPEEPDSTPPVTAEEPEDAVPPPDLDEPEELRSTEPESLEDQITRLEQVQDLRSAVDDIIKQRLEEGYFIRNPHIPIKVWNWTIGRVTNWMAGNTGGQCGDAAEWGRNWVKNDVRRIFGNNALVEELVVNSDGYSNHAATQVVLPNGDRYIVDMWEGMHEGSSRIYREDEWISKWKDRIGGDPPVLRNNHELLLEKTIRDYGNVKEGIDDYLHAFKDNEIARTTVKSYTKNPWFIP